VRAAAATMAMSSTTARRPPENDGATTASHCDLSLVGLRAVVDLDYGRTTGMLYSELLKHCPDWLRRAVAFSWETSLSRSDLFNLTWSEIDLAESIIVPREKREKESRSVSS